MTSKSIYCVLAALTLSACMDIEPTAVPAYEGPSIRRPSIPHPSTHAPEIDEVVVFLDPELEPVDLPGSACTCQTADCIADWVKDNVGCGLCIDLYCADGGTVGACVPCESPSPENVPTDGSIVR